MLEKINNIFKIPELRKKIGFTLFILFIYRLGGHVPTPGIDGVALKEFFNSAAGSNQLFGLYDMFVGGAFKKATIFALGIMPYISASIIIQLLGTVFPYFQKLQKDGPEGRQKITQYTRYGTVLIAMVQGVATAMFLQSMESPVSGLGIVIFPGFAFTMLTVLIMTTGTIFIMWLGEQITSRGLGNGISLIIFIGIVAQLPYAIIGEVQAFASGARSLFSELAIIAIVLAMVSFIVLVSQGIRKIPIQTPKKIVGRKVYGGQSSYLPLKVNAAGVIPVIFASSIVMIPGLLAGMIPLDIFQSLSAMFTPGRALYLAFYALFIIFFTYFYTAITFNPIDIADNLKKSGGFIPGVRPGKRTAEALDNVLNRITLPGSIFLAFIAVVPFWMISKMNVSFFLGGTSVLIVVGVALDTIQQIESHLLERHYDGFATKGKIRGRRG